ncbi:hypothetical protein [Psychroserpens sp. Hel_I_66]|uniref:hypothetical protein n=1 Tax=Psychroserpens sp. Hel_I_66 TaxID=1250004 RepID=UPI000648D5B4|nr:hypothetical protein [Psychroserpens sp. Hel_I_66]
MQKIFKLIISVCVIGTSFYGAFAQTETFKDVVLDGKPARLNIETGIITFYSGEVVKSKSALKIKDSINESNTVINKNLITTQDNLIL